MCGIVGFNWGDQGEAESLAKSMSHRGPDAAVAYAADGISLGHRRLSIIDLSDAGIQPMWTRGRDYAITFNGEVFNYKSLRSQLENKYTFKSQTDTEVILYGYKEWGEDVLDKLNGQFAFCIYDRHSHELFLARDRLGILPLHYYDNGDDFMFASELKPFIESDLSLAESEFARNYYFMYGHTPRGQTIFNEVKKLEPAHYMVYDLNSDDVVEKTQYWDVQPSGEITSEERAVKLIREELDRAVKQRMIADVPVGAFLSGGVDSSAVVAYMSQYTDDLNTFSVSFDEADFDESEYAELVADKYGTNHHVINFSSDDVRDLLPDLIEHYDDPFADPSMIPMYLVSQVASDHVTVSLSGDGGDELFGGYTSYKYYKLVQAQDYYPSLLNKIGYGALKNLDAELLRKPKAFFEVGMLDDKHKFARLMSHLDRDETKTLTGDNPEEYYDHYAQHYHEDHYLNEATNIDLHTYLPEDILTKVDRAAMAHSLESRPPLLDHKLVELAAKIHPSLKRNNGEPKSIFKKALADKLPDEILYREKQGFGVPLKHYFRNDLRPLVEKHVLDKNHGFSDEIKEALNKDHWEKDYSRIIWTLLQYQLWKSKLAE